MPCTIHGRRANNPFADHHQGGKMTKSQKKLERVNLTKEEREYLRSIQRREILMDTIIVLLLLLGGGLVIMAIMTQ